MSKKKHRIAFDVTTTSRNCTLEEKYRLSSRVVIVSKTTHHAVVVAIVIGVATVYTTIIVSSIFFRFYIVSDSSAKESIFELSFARNAFKQI